MAKLTLSDLANLQNESTAVTTINANSTLIETALENTLSRDGTSPNTMGADLDMNSNQILNLPSPTVDSEPVTLAYLETFLDDNGAVAGSPGSTIHVQNTAPSVTGLTEGSIWIDQDSTDLDLYELTAGAWVDTTANLKGAAGSMAGPVSSTDNAVTRFDGITGTSVQNSGVIIDDSNNVSGVGTLASGAITSTGEVKGDTLAFNDSNDSHKIAITTGSDATANRTLTINPGDADRTVTISGNATISQDYSSTGSPTFAAPAVTTIEVGHASDTTLSRASAGTLAVEGVNLLTTATGVAQGKHTLWIPAQAMWARTTNGPGAASRELTTGGDIMIKGWAFDTTTEEGVQFYIGFPKSWNKSTVTFQAFWTNASGLATETVSWGLSAGAYTDDDPIDTTDLGTEVRVSDTFLAQGDMHVTSESAAVTIGNTPVNDDLVIGQIVRSVANDNMTGDAELLGIKIFYTNNASTDA